MSLDLAVLPEPVQSPSPRPAAAQAKAILAEWDATGHADTLAALGRFPHLRLDKSLVMDLVYEEYIRRTSAGEDVDLDQFCARFPDHQISVRKLLDAHRALDRHQHLLENAPCFRW